MDIGNDGLGIFDALVNAGNDGMGVGNDYICIYRKFSLKAVG